jgi:hypothetical protein
MILVDEGFHSLVNSKPGRWIHTLYPVRWPLADLPSPGTASILPLPDPKGFINP